MLEEYFAVPSAAKRARAGIFDAHLDAFCSLLAGLGYRRNTIRQKIQVVGCLVRWMAKHEIDVVDLDERRVEEFVQARRRDGRRWRGLHTTVFLLLEQLRSAGVVPTPMVVCDESPAEALVARYERYLRRERGLAETTIGAYLPFACEFVRECLDEADPYPGGLSASDVRKYLLKRVHCISPRSAQYVATVLRSFLRFLFLRGETETDLALLIPMVRRWRLSSVPRDLLSARDVDRVLCACDRSSAVGRRDHAILLLLARLGLRAGEVVRLELSDLRWRHGEIIVHGKGRVRDRLPLLPDVGEALALYLKEGRPAGSSRRVFLRATAPHRCFAHRSTVSEIVARALVRAGLAPATRGAHLFRHSLATSMLRHEASLAEIGQVLRHRSPGTTEIYAKLDFAALRDVALPWPATGGAR